MTEFFIYLNGTTRGPFSEERVQQLLAEGLLKSTDLASKGQSSELKPLSDLRSAPAAEERPRVSSGDTVAVNAGELPRLSPDELGPYSRSTLAPNETAYLRTSLHWMIFVRYGVLGLVLFFFVALPFAIAVQALLGSEMGWFALPLPAFVMVPPAIAFASSELVITNRRVLIKTGVVRRQTLEMFITKIESIAVDQGFLGRILDYGTVLIRGTGGLQEPFETIARPVEFRNYVQRLQAAHHRA